MRRRRWTRAAAGAALGALLGLTLRLWSAACLPEPAPRPAAPALVLAGVMTAARYLESRARAVHDTWARELPGRVLFFSAEGSRAPSLPLVALPGVDDGYPPQRKSFAMLLYMYERFGSSYDWFLRADDDVYVRGDRLATFLRALDPRRALFVGQAGRGVSGEPLALAPHENFCMGGPGVLLSREALRRVAPHLRECLRRPLSTHEDVELGRCVARYAGVSCTWSYDMQTIFHHNSSGADAYTGRLKRREVHRAITLHPVKDPRHMYRLHSHFKNLQIAELRETSLELHREIAESLRALNLTADRVGLLADGRPLFSDPPRLAESARSGAAPGLDRHRPGDDDDTLPYAFVSRALYTHGDANPRRRVPTALKEALDDVIRETMDAINAPSRRRGRVIDFTELLYGYTRLDPRHGADHALDMLLRYRRYRGRKLTAAVRRHAYVQQSFTAMEARELPAGREPPPDESRPPDPDDARGERGLRDALRDGIGALRRLPELVRGADDARARRVRLVVPLAGRADTFARFLRNYEESVLRAGEAADLTVVLHRDPEHAEDYDRALALVRELRGRHRDAGLRVLERGDETFSRGAALAAGAEACADDDLLYFVDVDVTFTPDALLAARVHAVGGRSAYFPIVYSEFWSEEAARWAPGAADGHWRRYGYGTAALVRRDLAAAGGWSLGIRGWGLEDVALFEAVLRAGLTAVRAPDPALRHVRHAVRCAAGLPEAQRRMCEGTRAGSLASDAALRAFLLGRPDVLRRVGAAAVAGGG